LPPLGVEWRNTLATGDVQEIADIVLTKFCDLSANSGLHEEWTAVDETIEAGARPLLLGSPFAVRGVHFDPGNMDAYFQSPDRVRVSLAAPCSVDSREVDAFVEFLADVAAEANGRTVTF
jgi:hypothetical protein